MTEPVLVERAANALIADAEAGVRGVVLHTVLRGFKESYGGLWVGGKARLTAAEFTFTPNGLNRFLHASGRLDLSAPLVDIDDITVQPGFVTRIISLTVGATMIKVRCFKADAFAAQIRTAVDAAKRAGE